MHLLDFGCGVGDVAFLAAQFVGRRGKVIGIDRSEAAVQTARARAAQMGLRNVAFYCGDETSLDLLVPQRSLHAVVGRIVLMHQRNPGETLKQLATRLRPGGLAVFQEAQVAPGWCGAFPSSSLLTQVSEWITAACDRAGIQLNMGLKLRCTFLEAGFNAPQLTLVARVEGGAESPIYEFLAEGIRTLLPILAKYGIASADEVDIDTLAARLCAEAEAQRSALVMAMLVGGYATLPD